MRQHHYTMACSDVYLHLNTCNTLTETVIPAMQDVDNENLCLMNAAPMQVVTCVTCSIIF